MFEVIEDTLIDGVKLVPFLFITYLFMEILEHKMNNNLKEKIAKAGKTGPVWGGILGVIPQCGFSTAGGFSPGGPDSAPGSAVQPANSQNPKNSEKSLKCFITD